MVADFLQYRGQRQKKEERGLTTESTSGHGNWVENSFSQARNRLTNPMAGSLRGIARHRIV
jgi:hypothetical protein